jgi:hypothetical protein
MGSSKSRWVALTFRRCRSGCAVELSVSTLGDKIRLRLPPQADKPPPGRARSLGDDVVIAFFGDGEIERPSSSKWAWRRRPWARGRQLRFGKASIGLSICSDNIAGEPTLACGRGEVDRPSCINAIEVAAPSSVRRLLMFTGSVA